MSGPVSVSYDANNSLLALQVSNVSVPLTINFPGIGNFTVTTLQVNPNYSFNYAVYAVQLPVQPPAGFKYVHARTSALNITYLNGLARVRTEFIVW